MKYVFFDLDGTLVDTGEGIMASVRYALSSMGEPSLDEAAQRSFIGPPLAESFMRHCGFSEERAVEAITAFRVFYSTEGKNICRPYDGVREMLVRLREAGFVVAVATSKPTVFAEYILDRFALSQYFVRIVGSNLDNTRTKKHEVIEALLAELSVSDPSEIVMVGDKAQDLIGARICGTKAVGVTYGFGSAEELSGEPSLAILDSPEAVASFLLGE